MANHYEIPSWAGKPTTGLHLDVTKDGKLIQKLMIDQKKCWLFGRNPQMCDFAIDHASCSRVHSALVWHKHLGRAFLVDLGSTHGTFIGNMRIESEKPTQLPIDSTFHFGASSRMYILRERPQTAPRPILEELEEEAKSEHQDGGLLGLPETEMELDNLTEFNTAHNRRISMLGIADDDSGNKNVGGKRKKRSITFNEEEEVINPEDVDPSVGRFRNLVHTSLIIPTKRVKMSEGAHSGNTYSTGDNQFHRALSSTASTNHGLYGDLPPEMGGPSSSGPSPSSGLFSSSLASKLGLPLMPNPAPDVDLSAPLESPAASSSTTHSVEFAHPGGVDSELPSSSSEPKRKKYAKEAWPGRKPTPSLLI
uniref:Nuclear inhibitor of protein phosphatase 1 n=1 Tax=Eubosmina coregoni TaxID=186181 RepID=A0A4Y7LR58_9CRUS|nr:EOG090X07CE [Eubosmina coregoni]SVE69839.1 EOG090X07CE [Eubosmina coregoni]